MRYTADQSPTVILKPGETRELKPLHLHSRTKSIAGTVVDPEGKPLAGVRLDVQMLDHFPPFIPGLLQPQPTTGQDGRFHIGHLPDVRLQVMAYLSPPEDSRDRRIRNSTSVEVNSGDQEIRIILDPTPRKER